MTNTHKSTPIAIFWFRRDLRLYDNAGLYHALRSGLKVQPIFIFDTDILDALANKTDKRVQFIHDALMGMQQQLVAMGTTLQILVGKPATCFETLLQQYSVAAVYTNHDYEPYAQERDAAISAQLGAAQIPLHTYKDQVIFERSEVMKDDGKPYTVFTPYSKKWLAKLNDFYLKPYPVASYAGNYYQQPVIAMPSLEDIGFLPAPQATVSVVLNEDIARTYDQTRNFPAVNGTTRMSVHLRFGTVSIRELTTAAQKLNRTLLNELIWRDFYHMILWQFPHVVQRSFKSEYDSIVWRNNEREFAAWCAGQTGYPLVDAGMRELNQTGYMHNRVRMVVASFLTKHLLIDWRWGEAYFAEKLIDYDLAANNGGWQWAAGCGCDAAPYFRIFNPYLQTVKFDPDLKYVRAWVPEYEQLTYARPIVAHEVARERCLKVYKQGLGKDLL